MQFESQPNRTLMEIPMKNAYKAIFESGIPIRLATIDAPTESLGLVYGTRVWGDAGKRTSWEGEVFLIEPSRLWETQLLALGVKIVRASRGTGSRDR